MEKTYRRGQIYYADLNPVIGSEQGGIRPVLIISNDIGNRYSPTVIVAVGQEERQNYPHTFLLKISMVWKKIQSSFLNKYERLISKD